MKLTGNIGIAGLAKCPCLHLVVLRDDGRVDQSAVEEKTFARKNLFHPCSWADPSTCQLDDGPQAGSSHAHAAIGSPNKKPKAEPKGWSPDSNLPAKHPARDGLRPKYRKHVGFTPEKKYDPVD